MNLRDVAKLARRVDRAVKGGRKSVEQLRDGTAVALSVLDALGALTGHAAKNPSVGTLAGTAAALVSRMIPQAPVAAPAPVERPRAVTPTVTAPKRQRPLRVVADVIDAEIVPEGVVDPSKPYHRKAR